MRRGNNRLRNETAKRKDEEERKVCQKLVKEEEKTEMKGNMKVRKGGSREGLS